MAYKVADRAKEWTTYAGLAVAAIGAVVPSVPTDHWAQYWTDAQIILGAVLVLLPQTAGTTAVENEAMTLLQALSAKVPPQYAQAMQPFVTLLAKGMLSPNAPVLQQVRQQPQVQPLPAVQIPQQPLPGMFQQQSQVVAQPVADPAAPPATA
jgi:hypothetical protein